MSDKISCFLVVMNRTTFLIPSDMRDEFDGVRSYERNRIFESYIVPEEAIIDEIMVEEADIEALKDGMYE